MLIEHDYWSSFWSLCNNCWRSAQTPAESIEIETLGIRNEIIRDKKHHGGVDKAVCILSEGVIQHLQDQGHPISGGTTGENILLSVPYDALNPGVQLNLSRLLSKSPWLHHHVRQSQIHSSIRNSTNYPIKSTQERTRWYARVLE